MASAVVNKTMKAFLVSLLMVCGSDAFSAPRLKFGQASHSLSSLSTIQSQRHVNVMSIQSLSMSLSSSNNGSNSNKKMKKTTKLGIGRTLKLTSAIKSTISSNFNNSPMSKRRTALINILRNTVHKLCLSLSNLNDVGRWRVAAATFITSIFAFAPAIDVQLIKLWSWLQNDTAALLPRLFRHDHWEWAVAVWAFFFWIHGYWLVDRAVAKSDARGEVHPWKKYRLQDRYEAEKFGRQQRRKLQREGLDVDVDSAGDLNLVKPPQTKQHKWHLGFWIFELPLYCLPLYIWDICIPRRAAKLATWGAPTALGVCRDVTCALLLYDLGFFVCHYLMHKIPFIYKYVHAKHHTSTEVRASDIVRLVFTFCVTCFFFRFFWSFPLCTDPTPYPCLCMISFRLSGVEEVVDVGISILALNYLGCHPISRTIYNVIITFLLTELHCGYAFPWTPQFVVPFGLATGSKGHHYHHRFGKHYYQKFFCHVDKLFGFYQKKDSSLQGSTV